MKYRLVFKSFIALCMGLCICGGSILGTLQEGSGPEPSAESKPEAQPLADTDTVYQDGVYIGKGTGFKGTITATVTIQGGKITDIQLENEADDEPFFTNASALVDSVLAAQSADVDVVSGATYSSRGILQAIRNALALASGQETEALEDAAGASASASSGKVSAGSSSIDETNAVYRDGTYTGTGQGFKSTITATVTIQGGKIASIRLSGGDDAAYWNKAKALAGIIVRKQSTNVDVISGASYSSRGILQAVRNALAKAVVNGSAVEETPVTLPSNSSQNASKPSPLPPVEDENTVYHDGTYTGTGKGFKGTITATVTIQGGKITSIRLQNEADDEPFFTNASALTDTIIQTQSTDVDVVSGATYSSNGIISAVRNALAKAARDPEQTPDEPEQPGTSEEPEIPETPDTPEQPEESGDAEQPVYRDGTYTGTGTGFNGTITATVTIQGGKITDIQLENEADDEPFFTNASALTDTIIQTQSTDVDVVSGATYSSRGILEAVDNALAQALREEEPAGYPDGLYTGEAVIAEGFDKNVGFQRYTVTAVVCIENSEIRSVAVTTDDEIQNNGRNERWITMACDSVPLQPVGLTDLGKWEYEAVSGATYSSDAIRDAIRNALSAMANGGENE